MEQKSKDMVEKGKNKVGRPTSLTPSLLKKTKEIMAQGKSENVAIRELGISRDTFYRWKRENPEFASTVADGKVYGQSVHEELIEAIAQGRIQKANTAAYQMYMRNVYGWDKNQGEGSYSQTINIGNMNVLEQKDTQDLLAYIHDVQLEIAPLLDEDVIDVEFIDEDNVQEQNNK